MFRPEVYTERQATAVSYWPEGMTWRDYADACPICDGPAPDCGFEETSKCSNMEESELE